MRKPLGLLTAVAIGCASAPALAAEGFAIAGPVGGTDIRSAMLPPPGFYGGLILVHSEAREFFVPPARFSARLALPAPVSQAEYALFAGRRLLAQMEGFLAAHACCASASARWR